MKEKAPSETTNISEHRVEAELLKLSLEIENLRHKNKWESKIAAYIPLLTVLIAVAGFLFGIYQFQAQQRQQQDRAISEQQKDRGERQREQTSRIQEKINSDVDRLLRFTSNNEITISEVVYALNDLKFWLNYSSPEKEAASELIDQERKITESLIEIIVTDCDFDNLRDSDFSNTVLDTWKDYSDSLKGNDSDRVPFILSKYAHALNRLRIRDAQYFETIQYNQEKEIYEHCNCISKEQQFLHFLSLKNGFEKHLELLEKNSKFRETGIREFQAALCNALLTEQLFNESYPDVHCY